MPTFFPRSTMEQRTRFLMASAAVVSALCTLAVMISNPLMASAQVTGSSSSSTSSVSSPTQTSSSTSSSSLPPITCDQAKNLRYNDYGSNGHITLASLTSQITYAYLKWQGPQVFYWVNKQTINFIYDLSGEIQATWTRDYTYNRDPRTVDLSTDRLFAKAHHTYENFMVNKKYDEYYSVTSYGENPRYDNSGADKYPSYSLICDTKPAPQP